MKHSFNQVCLYRQPQSRRSALHLAVLMLISLSACASAPKNFTFVPAEKTTVTDDSGKTMVLEKNNPYSLNEGFVRIEQAGKVPLLVVNHPQPSAAPYALTLKPLDEWKAEKTESYIVASTDEITLALLTIMDEIRHGKTDNASSKAESLIKSHPKLSMGYYIKAQIQVIQSQKSQAIESLNTVLAIHPEFEPARILKQKLQGGRT